MAASHYAAMHGQIFLQSAGGRVKLLSDCMCSLLLLLLLPAAKRALQSHHYQQAVCIWQAYGQCYDHCTEDQTLATGCISQVSPDLICPSLLQKCKA